MPAFTINTDNHITVLASSKQIEGTAEGTETFSNAEQLAALAAHWPAARLIQIWNRLPGMAPVERFSSRQVAAGRIWKAIQHWQAAADAKPAAGQNTKAAQVIALLRQPTGATLKTIMAATGWQAHSVRGFISGQIGKKLGLPVKSFPRDGERVYRIRQG
jgi:hypothetical protein